MPKSARALFFEVGEETVMARSVTLPARPYLGWGDAEREGLEDLVEVWLEDALSGERR